jgi:hypothetical protein
MLRVLTRDPSPRLVPPGQYQFTIGRGDVRRMGNERAFRLNGLPLNFRQRIHDTVSDRVDSLDKTQLAALVALALEYASEVYTPRLIADETGAEVATKGFAAAVAEQLASDLRDRARRKGATPDEMAHIERVCSDVSRLAQWTEAVPDSDADAYSWEVRETVEPRLKRAVKPEFFTTGWLEANVLTAQAQPSPPPFNIQPVGGVAPPPGVQYHLAINGQRSGPHVFANVQQWIVSGQLLPSVLAWRDGLADWIPLNRVPEFAPLFAAGSPPPLPGSGPPPIPGQTLA